MNKILSILFVFIASLGFSQKHVNAIIIKTDNDTINSKIKIKTNTFHKNLINETSFYKTLFLVDENGKSKEKIKAKNVKELQFTDLNGESRIYLNNGKALKELLFDGKKIKWFREIYPNSYNSSVQYSDYLIDHNGKEYKLGLFNSAKKKLLEATKSKPEIASEIENSKLNKETILHILKKYDE